MQKCIIPECDNKKHTKIGYCSGHYAKFKKYGDPLAGRQNKYKPGDSPQKCTVQGCDSSHSHGGMCQAHYLRKKNLGSTDAIYESERKKECSVDNCSRSHYAKGYCSKHYQNYSNHGDPLYAEKSSVMGWIESNKNHKGDECLLWPFSRLTNGYGVVQHEGMKRIASRVMCEAAHGLPESNSLHAAHSCGNGSSGCVNPRHLRWATPKENAKDKEEHGTVLFGENAPWSKLTADDVMFIRRECRGMSAREVADIFDISCWAVYSVRNGKNWRHLPDE